MGSYSNNAWIFYMMKRKNGEMGMLSVSKDYSN